MRIITALVTPFHKDKSLDIDSLKKLVLFQKNSEVDGILILGTTSECFSLTLKEKFLILDTCFSNFNRTKIIGLDGNNLEHIKNQIDLFSSYNPDYFLIPTPYFNKGNENGIIEYFNIIADYSFIPIIIYHVPNRTSYHLSYDIIKILSKHKNIQGIKNCSYDQTFNLKITELNNENFMVLSGNDNSFLNHLTLNNNGIISVLSNVIPNYLTSIYDLFFENIKKSIINFKKIIPIINSLSDEVNPYMIKKIMHKLNITNDVMRLPFLSANQEYEYELDERIFNEYFTDR